jgi:hypothetical protein
VFHIFAAGYILQVFDPWVRAITILMVDLIAVGARAEERRRYEVVNQVKLPPD